MKVVLLCLFGALMCLSKAFGEPLKAKAVLTQNSEGFFLDFGHGYRAQLFVGTLPSIGFQSSLQIAESTCGGFTGDVTCTYATKYGMNKVNWLWIAHPDPSQIGQPISYKKSAAATFKALDGNTAYKTFYAPDRHSAANKTPPDTLACTRYDWIPEKALKKNLITTWYASNMANNSETLAAENRALFGVVGVHFKIEKNVMVMRDYDEVQVFSDFFINPFMHDQQSMIFNDGSSNCQVNWTRRVQPAENKRYFDEQMRPITEEKPVPLKKADLFTANQVKAATIEFTRQEVFLQ